MRLKKKSEYKVEKIHIRMTTLERNQLQIFANIYCDGNLSEFVRHCVLNFQIEESDLEIGGAGNGNRD